MPLITFACPACQKVLKSAVPIAAGTKVRCPTCGASFAMSAQAAGHVAVPSANGAAAVALAGGRGVKRAVLTGATALILLAGLAAGAYFLFFGGGSGATPEEDPLAYLPAGTEFVAGADFPTLLDDPLLGPSIEQAIREQAGAGDFLDRCRTETGLGTRDLLGHALLAGKLDVLDGAKPIMASPLDLKGRVQSQPPVTLILKTSRPFDPEQVARAAGRAVARRAHGKTYYEVNVGQMRTLYMPSQRIIVLSALPAADLDAVFGADGTRPNLSADGVALVRGVEAHPLWAAVPLEGAARERLDLATVEPPRPADVGSLLVSLNKAKGAAVWAGPDGERIRFGANLPCTDDAAAAQVVADAEAAWKTKKAEIGIGTLLLHLTRPKTAQALRELTDGLKFTPDGKTARLTGDVGRKTLADASEELEQNGAPGLGLPGFGKKKR